MVIVSIILSLPYFMYSSLFNISSIVVNCNCYYTPPKAMLWDLNLSWSIPILALPTIEALLLIHLHTIVM